MVSWYAAVVDGHWRRGRRLGIEHIQSNARTVLTSAPVVFWLELEMDRQFVPTGDEFRFMDGTAHFC